MEDDQHCFVCGEKNPIGFRLRFFARNGKALAEFTPQKIHQGYKDITHGGLICTILDEAMVKAAIMQGFHAVTAEISVRYRNPLLSGEKAVVEGAMLKVTRKIIEAAAVIKKSDETVVAEGTAKLLRLA